MSILDKESLVIDIETSANKANHMAESIIQKYNLDMLDPDKMDDAILAENRSSLWIEMEILSDYIREISAKSRELGEAL